jgi:hypothetical protein
LREVVTGIEEFMGLQTDVERSARAGASKDENGDRSVRGAWKTRLGLADTGISDGTDRIDSAGWGRCDLGNFYVLATSAGDIIGGELPDPDWTSA